MCSPYWSFISLVFLMTYSVEGSSYCMANCNSNGHQSSLYLQYCCHPSNRGKTFKIQGEDGHRLYILLCPSAHPASCPVFSSCSQLYEVYTAPSDYYNITLSNGSQVEIYCDMEGSHCDGEAGWTRVAFVNMSVSGSSCPPGLVQYNISNINLCWINDNYTGCNSAFFSNYGLNYTKVCGRVRGYQYGNPHAFNCYINNANCFNSEIKTYGVTLTYGNNPRKHTWTYAGGYYEQGTSSNQCPCNNGSPYMNYTIPFVGNDCYCESGINGNIYKKLSRDHLWDGKACPREEATCCTSPKMPWFVKTLNETANDDIVLNVCGGNDNSYSTFGGTPFDLVELYIK